MKVAFVGCGYVADSYMKTFRNYPDLQLIGVHDRNEERESKFASLYSVKQYRSLERLLEDSSIDIVVNLTNPASHFDVTKACLHAGKHVYSEKPLAMALSQAEELVILAKGKGLRLSGAPCTILGEAAQTFLRALRNEDIGQVRLVYAEIDDGPLDIMGVENWKSASGHPWNYQDEFEVGCTLEHAGYYVSWMCAFFGSVERVTAFSSCLKPSKLELTFDTPDFSVACIHFESGMVARLTAGIYAPHDHTFQVIGDKGRIYVDNCWHFAAKVHIERHTNLSLRAAGHPYSKIPFTGRILGPKSSIYPPVRKTALKYKKCKYYIDFVSGISELAMAIKEDRVSRISPEFLLHINEVILGIQAASESGASFEVKSDIDPIDPMPWAQSRTGS